MLFSMRIGVLFSHLWEACFFGNHTPHADGRSMLSRSRAIWTLAGLVLGVWAVGTLFFVAERDSDQSLNIRS